jgi:hypothetical protein
VEVVTPTAITTCSSGPGSPAIDLGVTKFSQNDVTGRAVDGSDGPVDAGAYEYDE